MHRGFLFSTSSPTLFSCLFSHSRLCGWTTLTPLLCSISGLQPFPPPFLSAWLSFSLFTRNVPSQISCLSASPLAFIWYENWKNVFCWGNWLSPKILGGEEIPWFLLVQRCFSLSEKWILVTQSCPTHYDRMDYSPPGSSVHGILQARILEWVPFPSPGDLPHPWIKTTSEMQEDSTIWACQTLFLALAPLNSL